MLIVDYDSLCIDPFRVKSFVVELVYRQNIDKIAVLSSGEFSVREVQDTLRFLMFPHDELFVNPEPEVYDEEVYKTMVAAGLPSTPEVVLDNYSDVWRDLGVELILEVDGVDE